MPHRTEQTTLNEQPWHGRWCWTRKHQSRPWNTYAYFRRTVELRARPQRAVIRISAESRYTLYVNGRRVHFGPARSYPEFQSYDALDLAPLLDAGANAICIIVHQFGVPTFQSVYRDISGVIVDGTVELDGDTVPLSTPDGWLCRESKAWRKEVVRRTVQLGFQEHFDADADPNDWMSPAYEPKPEEGWTAPYNIGPVGTWPWLNMEPRGVPLLADQVENFAAILAQFRGENARGYKVAEDVYHLPLQEEHKADRAPIANRGAMLLDDDSLTTIDPPPDGEFLMIVLDLGQYRTGHAILDIAEASGDEIIDLIYTEAVDKSNFPLLSPLGSGCEEATADRYRCRPGAQWWETFNFNGMRYCTLVLRNVEKPLKIRRVALRQVHAAVEDVGSFQCSDEKLTRIWHTARQTQRNCLFDAFVDCPWREQAMWWGDARVQAKVTAFAFGDTSLLERGIRLMARSQGPDGSLHSHPPADIPGHRLPDFMLTWVSSLWDYYFYTAKDVLLAQSMPAIHRLMQFFSRHEINHGLVGGFDGWWLFLDWQSLYKGDYSAVLNMMYLKALRDAAEICRITRDDAAGAYDQKAKRLAQAIEKHFWDEQSKQWRDGFDAATNKPVQQVSQHANTLAILLGLQPEHHARIAREVLLKSARSKRTKILSGSPFFYAYILQAMAQAGLRQEAVELMGEKWGEMLEEGATVFWELWDVTLQSRCHAWSASPLYHLAEQVLGVQQVEPGWRKVKIVPQVGDLDYARGTVPTPGGLIRVEWEKAGEDQFAVRIDLPPGIEAEFIAPGGPARLLEPGANEFHT